MEEFCHNGVDAQTLLNNPALIKNTSPKKLISNLNKSNVVFNSKLTHDVHEFFKIKPINSSVLFFNFAPYVLNNTKPFNNRIYDIGFIVSNFSRTIKNPKLMSYLFEAFPENKKIAIGKRRELFSNMPNLISFDIMSQKEIAKILSEIKLLIIPSYFDSSPSILSEAILNGCNVLISKNIGWNEMLEEKCVVQNYQDENEWKNKIEFLLKNKVDYNHFLNKIKNSKKELLNSINNLIT